MQNKKIPLFEPFIGREEKKNVIDCIDSNWISSKGKYIKKFETQFGRLIKTKYSITVNNGTAALHLALLALGVKKQHEVIVPTFTYIAPVNAIRYINAKVKFVDSKINTSQIDEELITKLITKKTKAIIVPHLYGQIAEIEKIKKICQKNKIFLIEDSAEAFGCYYKKKHVGTIGDIGTFSFFGSKTITTGEGGMVVTNNKKLAEKIFKLKTVGVVQKKNNYWHDIIGYNYRMTNLCASIGLAQLNKTDLILKKKREVFNFYDKYLNKINVRLNEEIDDSVSSFWQITAFFNSKLIRNKVRNLLEKNNIETRTTFPPVHTMPMYYNKSNRKKFPIANILYDTGICLPSSPTLKGNQIMKICSLINKLTS
jgi:perosamine synthetase